MRIQCCALNRVCACASASIPFLIAFFVAFQQGIVEQLNGYSFFGLYLPEFGCEARYVPLGFNQLNGLKLDGFRLHCAETALCLPRPRFCPCPVPFAPRLHTDALGLPLYRIWNKESKTLLLTDQPPAGFLLRKAAAVSVSDFALQPWLAELQGRLHNPSRLAPVQLPLELKAFSKVPVVVSTKVRPRMKLWQELRTKNYTCGKKKRMLLLPANSAACRVRDRLYSTRCCCCCC